MDSNMTNNIIFQDPPEGVLPFSIDESSAEELGLKDDHSTTAERSRKSFQTNTLLDEIQKYGSNCPFEPFRSYLESCGLDTVAVLCDDSLKYGKQYLLLYKQETIDKFQIEEKENKSVDGDEKIVDANNDTGKSTGVVQMKIKNEQRMMYTCKPFIPKTYVSTTSLETEKEIASLMKNSINNRPLLETVLKVKYSCQNQRSVSFKDGNFLIANISNRDDMGQELKNTSCFVRDTWCQAPTNESVESSTQTHWSHKVNKIIQYETLTLADWKINHEQILGEVCTFFKTVLPRFEECLQQNETLDIYADYFDFGKRSDVSTKFAHNEEDSMKERANFTDLDFSKGRYISIIDTHPDKNIVAVSVCEPSPQDDQGLSSKLSSIILWNLKQQMHPYLILKAPFDCFTLRFNPSSPETIVGGGTGGQVVMWNTNNILAKNTNSSQVDPHEHEQLLLEPIVTSVPDHSHKQMIADIKWLPPHIQINAKGLLLEEEYLSDVSYQFISISSDGSILFWDTRYKDILMGKLPFIAKVKGRDKKSLHGHQKWAPLFKIKPRRLIGTGELSFCKAILPTSSDVITTNKAEASSTIIVCASEEGEILQVNWSPKPDCNTKDNEKESEVASPDEYVQWMVKGHNRPCVTLSQNCAFSNFVLSASDWNFRIWKTSAKSASEVFLSPNASCQITDGTWSPSRPAVLFIAKSNGYVDVWDFTDSCYTPSYSFSLVPTRINSIKILEEEEEDVQYLLVGDNIGTLHVFDVPRNLAKPSATEKEFMLNLLQKVSTSKSHSVNEEIENNDFTEAEDKDDNGVKSVQESVHDGLSEEEESEFLKLQNKFMNF